MSNSLKSTSVDPVLIVFLGAFIGFTALFIFRSLDDNRLFNWQWIFAGGNALRIYIFLLPGLAAASAFSRLEILERNPRTFLVLFSYMAAVIFWPEPELLVDASRYFTQAKHLEVYGTGYFLREWGGNIAAWTDLPAIPFLYGQIFRLLGENRVFVQAFTTFLFSGTVVLTYHLGRTLWDEETGFIAGLLLLGMPYLLTQVPLMLVDVPTMFFLTLSIFAFTKALDRGGAGMTVLASCALFFAVFSKYSTWPMLSILGIVFLVYRKKDPAAALRRSAAVALLSCLLIGSFLLFKFGAFSEQIRLLLSYQKPGLERWGESFVSTFLFQIHPIITFAALYSFFVAFKKKNLRYVIACWLVVVIFVFQIRRIRYILPVFPLVALMAAYGLRNIEGRSLRKLIAFTAVITSLIIAVFAYRPFALSISAENLKRAGEYLNSLATESVEVVTLPLKDPVVNPSVAVPLLDFYTRKGIVYRYHPDWFPPPQDLATSSLRFSWEFRDPEYYRRSGQQENNILVIIGGETENIQSAPPAVRSRLQDFRLLKKFAAASDPFRYKTIAEVYSRR